MAGTPPTTDDTTAAPLFPQPNLDAQHLVRIRELLRMTLTLLFLCLWLLLAPQWGLYASAMETPTYALLVPMLAYLLFLLPLDIGFAHRIRATGAQEGSATLRQQMLCNLLRAMAAGYLWLIVAASTTFFGRYWLPLAAAIIAFTFFKLGNRLTDHHIQGAVPLGDEDALEQFRALAQAHGLPIIDFLKLQSTPGRPRYALSVLDKRKAKVYLDNSVLALPLHQRLLVVAHEFGHIHSGPWRLSRLPLFIMALLILTPVYVVLPEAHAPQISDAPLVFAAACLGNLLAKIFLFADSRRCETAANAFALQITRDPAALIAVTRALEPDCRPQTFRWWEKAFFLTHPSAGQVIAQARDFAAKNKIPLAESPAET